jgi:hypothetical protein
LIKALDGEHESRLLKKSGPHGRNREHNGFQGRPERNRTAAEISFSNSLLEVFRGAPKGALFEAYLSPSQFEDSNVVRSVPACHFSRQPSNLL